MMKLQAAAIALLLGLDGSARAQGTDVIVEAVRACSQLRAAERVDCLDLVFRKQEQPRTATPPADATSPPADRWTVSETTSPVDYSPIVVASASSGNVAAGGRGLKLSLHCRRARSEVLIDSDAIAGRPEEYVLSYQIGSAPPVTAAVAAAASAPGLSLKGDVSSFLMGLPDRGQITFRVSGSRISSPLEGQFALPAMKSVLERLAPSCKWRAPAGGRSN